MKMMMSIIIMITIIIIINYNYSFNDERRGNMRLKQWEEVEQKISFRGKGHFVCVRHVETESQGSWN